MRAILVCMALIVSGCSKLVTYTKLPPQDSEHPSVSVPKEMHIRNWVDRSGAGSCVHASTLYLMQWQGLANHEVESWKKSHAGGETARSIQQHYERAGYEWCCTERGDPGFLEWANKSRMGCILWWKPSHCCTFVGFWEHPEKGTLAAVYDNNYPGRFEYHKKEDFIRAWRGFGGFAATVLIKSPATPVPWPIFQKEN